MEMFYSDMTDVQLLAKRREFRFRIPHTLDKFGADYNPSRQHLFIRFVSEADTASFRSIILPVLRRSARSGART